ncbi:MAG: TonB-dependent receptor [candidate division Zixibacteria bacterium]|nr:TonB-dependent receptor [candidate division Zixibacteria bacterium]
MRKTFLLIIFLLNFSYCIAEETKNADKLPVYYLEPVIVTATRYPLDLSRIPNYASLLTKNEIHNRNPLNLGDALKNLAGLDFRTNGILGQNSTISLRGPFTSQVLVLQDGRALNSLTYGNYNLSDFSVENVERLEIVRGPLSSLYGANALAGVINIITKDKMENIFSSSLTFGDFNTQIYSFDFSPKLNDFSFLFGVERKSTDGDRKNSEFYSLSTNSKLTYEPSDRFSSHLLVVTQKDTIGIPGVVPDPNNVPAYGDKDVYSLYDKQKDLNWSADLSSDIVFREKDMLSGKIYLDRRKLDYHTLYDMWDSYYNTVKTVEDDRYITTTYGGYLQYLLYLKDEDKLSFGFDFHQDQLKTRQNFDYEFSGFTDLEDIIVTYNPKTENLAGWGNLNMDFGKLLTFQLGARYDHHSLYSGDISPNFGLIFHLNENGQIKFSYGQAFRAPTFNDLYWPQGGNKNLKPEKGESYEVSLCLNDKDNYFDLTFFSRQVKDLITWAPLGENNLWQPFNLDKYEAWGIEADAEISLSKHFKLNHNWTLNLGEETKKLLVYSYYDYGTGETTQRFEETKRDASFTPKLIINLGLEVSTKFGLEASLDLNHLYKRANYYADYSDYPNISYKRKTIPASTNLDLSLNQKMTSKVYLFAKVYNLFDQKNPTRFGNSLYDKDYPDPGRRVNGGVRIEI